MIFTSTHLRLRTSRPFMEITSPEQSVSTTVGLSPQFLPYIWSIGRIAGQDGKTKFTSENASRTRIVLADTCVRVSCLVCWLPINASTSRKIHILGSFQNIKVARDAIVSLILGSPPGKVYAGLRTVSSRMRQRAL